MRVASVLALCLVFAGCPGQDNDTNVNQNANSNNNSANENATATPLLYPAAWQRTSGTLFSSSKSELAYLVLNADSTLEMYHRDPGVGFITCSGGLFEQGAAIVTFTFPGPESRLELLAYELPDANTLNLRDVAGEITVFTRVTLPANATCLELSVLNTYTGLPRPSNWSGLASDNTLLWYTNTDGWVQRLSLAGAPGPAGHLSFNLVHGYQASALWLLSTADADAHVAQRRNAFDILQDEVDTEALGAPTSLRSLAYDDANHVLWLHGTIVGSDGYQMLRVNSDAEPDVLLDVRAYDANIRSMAWDGASLWLLFGEDDYVIQVDPTTLAPLHIYTAPSDVDWVALAWVEDSLYLLGAGAGGGVLIQTQP